MAPMGLKFLSKREQVQSKPVAKPTHGGQPERLNEIYAILRRMSARLSDLETQTGNLRRDFNRVDRAGYRARERGPILNNEGGGRAALLPPLMPDDVWSHVLEGPVRSDNAHST
jgi:hypothetical protein